VFAAEVVVVVSCAAAGAVVRGALVDVLFGDGVAVVRVVVVPGRGLVAGLRVRVTEVVALADAPVVREPVVGPVCVIGVVAVAEAPADRVGRTISVDDAVERAFVPPLSIAPAPWSVASAFGDTGAPPVAADGGAVVD
jgi:hypothetical protein